MRIYVHRSRIGIGRKRWLWIIRYSLVHAIRCICRRSCTLYIPRSCFILPTYRPTFIFETWRSRCAIRHTLGIGIRDFITILRIQRQSLLILILFSTILYLAVYFLGNCPCIINCLTCIAELKFKIGTKLL